MISSFLSVAIYRLDRLTSGVLIFGRSAQKSKELEDQVVQRKMKKEYVCRVVGEFPRYELLNINQ